MQSFYALNFNNKKGLVMQSRQSFLKLTLTCALLGTLGVAACSPVKYTRGNLIEPEQLEQAQSEMQILTERDVLRMFGTPTSKSIFNDNVWYYVGMKTEQTAFFDEEITEKRMISVAFDESGTVDTISTIDSEGYEVPISKRKTPTSGHNLTVLQQLLGNIGRFNPTSDL
jgi:outer membrane protein assembly factor BamE (lipoprotein component of BamABCDE complex)